jgi:ABC-2 type transport system ATP-binding protein
MSVIELDGLSVRLAGQEILRDLTCSLEGKAIGLLGPNGAGKSTLIRTLLGFHRPDAGAGRLLGLDVTSQHREVRSLIGYMPENDAFIQGMSAVRFLRYMAELHGLPPEDAMERAHEALAWTGLGEARYRNVDEFSTGMKQRVKLAQAIVHGPRLLLLDEPTNGLDPPGRAQMLSLVRDLREVEGLHILISSHLLRDVEQVADKVVILKDGRIARTYDLEAARESNFRYVELELVGEADGFLSELVGLGCEHATTLKERVKVVVPPDVPMSELFGAAVKNDVTIHRLDQRRDTLEDVFLEAMGEDPMEAAHDGA